MNAKQRRALCNHPITIMLVNVAVCTVCSAVIKVCPVCSDGACQTKSQECGK